MRSKTYDRHLTQLQTGYYPEGFINGLRKAMHNKARRINGRSTSKSFSGMSDDEIKSLVDYIHRYNPKIMPEQAAKGYEWLLSKWKTPKGAERKHNPFGFRETSVLENFKGFRLVDFKDISTTEMPFYVPVYEVESHDGNSFIYYAAAWQSGGNGPKIIKLS
jgi:hypothetical protein